MSETPAARFYCPHLPAEPGDAADPSVELDNEQARHARRVLRLKPGDRVELFDGAGRLARATLDVGAGGVRCRVEHVEVHDRVGPVVTVASAMPKGSRAEDMVDMLAQLGVDRVLPLRTQRSVVHPRPGKLERLERRAIEAAKQSRRLWVTRVEPTRDLADVLGEEADVRLIASLGAAARPLPKIDQAVRITVLIGPEGGWTREEEEAVRTAGYQPVSLGAHVMRIETAAVAAAAIVGSRM
ncbi:MAG: RsmE family RNA methyltransferase [Phycisphaeraceae bacterium]